MKRKPPCEVKDVTVVPSGIGFKIYLHPTPESETREPCAQWLRHVIRAAIRRQHPTGDGHTMRRRQP